MKDLLLRIARCVLRLFSALAAASFFIFLTILFAQRTHDSVFAAPIDPPEGYPKLDMSTKVVSPTLAHTGGETLYYEIEIVNTGAFTAEGVTLTDPIPLFTSYNNDAAASVSPTPTITNGVLTWVGDVGFDSSVLISFSVDITTTYSGTIANTAVISHSLISKPISVTAETLVTDQPIFTIRKTSAPALPGANKPLAYSLEVTNIGQPTGSLDITVTDPIPENTTFQAADPDGSSDGQTVTWNRNVNLDTGASSLFTFTVDIGDVLSGTVLTNQNYQVSSLATETTIGEVYTSTVIDPIFSISKSTFPDPPGSNGEMTYTLTVLNKGSLATDLVVTDQVPSGVTYDRGGTHLNGEVSWQLPSLDTGASAQFTYTVDIGDVANVNVLNSTYKVCSAEGVCKFGDPFSSLVHEPSFSASVWLDPIAKKPGGGNSPVTPTLVLRNDGPGSALAATALLYFERISVSENDLVQVPANGLFTPGPECGGNCVSYRWVGDLAAGETITFTTKEGQNSVGGDEGTLYTATLVITDQLGANVTQPYTATASGIVTHLANLIPTKTAPPVIGAGEVMTYVIEVFNSGLSTDVPPYPVLTETIPTSVTLLTASDGGVTSTVDGKTLITWELPALSTGSRLFRSFSVQVDNEVVSGTQIVNQDYGTTWHNIEATGVLSNTGTPVTTTVREVGLIDSFKSVSPTLVHPGPDHVLTYTVHVVNSGPTPLTGVSVQDALPWKYSTYLRDATASSGEIVSDIVSLSWNGDVAPFATELITFSVLVDDDFEGVITNTATITHTSLSAPVDVSAAAYVTNLPVFTISKVDSPDPVWVGEELQYTIHVANVGQEATNVVITDSLPANTAYVPESATDGGVLTGGELRWQFAVLAAQETRTLTFRVKVLGGSQVVNDRYGVSCAEGVSLLGPPVITDLRFRVYLPLVSR